MCGRFLLESDIDEIIRSYNIYSKEITEYKKGDFYPSQEALIVMEDEKRNLASAKWGYAYNNRRPVINARSETIMKKSMFKDSFYSARCIIPVNQFYEWKDIGNRKKVKHRIGLKDSKLISLGGIYKINVDENYNRQLTFVIITTEAEGSIRDIHSRMPLIIKNDELDEWLNKNTSIKIIEEILKSNTAHKLTIEICKEKFNGNDYEQLRIF